MNTTPTNPGNTEPLVAETVVNRNGVRLFLASRSPRRRELLAEAGYNFDYDHPGLEDSDLIPGEVTPREWVASLAYLKARAGNHVAHATSRTPDVIIGADTACVLDGRLIGTPRHAQEARSIIADLAGREHEVVTGLALICGQSGRRLLIADSARVRIGPLSSQEIDRYIDSGLWSGKAGAYNLTERLAAGWPIQFDGDPATIMGLPMKLLHTHLQRFITSHPETRA
ncbi:MAG: Maf-like protein [Phycisphaeraceae bacterium]|nr:Maf-like protein [Phycisphaeraceae bacterium]